MNKLALASAIGAAILTANTAAAVQEGFPSTTTALAVRNSGSFGQYRTLPPGSWNNGFPSGANLMGSDETTITRETILVDPSNQLVVVVNYDPNSTFDNISWSLEEWTQDGQQFNRCGRFGGTCGPVISCGYGRAFVTHGRSTDLKNRDITGVTSFSEGYWGYLWDGGEWVWVEGGSRAGEDNSVDGGEFPLGDLLPLGDHVGSSTVTGKLDKDGNGTFKSIFVNVIGKADLLRLPESDDDQTTLTFSFRGVKPIPLPDGGETFYNFCSLNND